MLDLWFAKRFARPCEGRAYLVRYADDFVARFRHESDARRFREALVERLGQFGLEVEPTKSALLCFGSQAAHLRQVHGLEQAATFNFLGFTHDVGRSRRGKFVPARKTQRERMAKKLKAFGDRLKQLRTRGGRVMMLYACQHLRGHLAYYAVSGNSRSLRQYFYAASRVLFKWLNRRSQRRRFSWQRFGPVLRDRLPPIRIRHQLYPAYGE